MHVRIILRIPLATVQWSHIRTWVQQPQTSGTSGIFPRQILLTWRSHGQSPWDRHLHSSSNATVRLWKAASTAKTHGFLRKMLD